MFPRSNTGDRVPEAAAFPGKEPEISNPPARNVVFTGRAEQLAKLRERLTEATCAAVLPVQAVHGLGGVGKTELCH